MPIGADELCSHGAYIQTVGFFHKAARISIPRKPFLHEIKRWNSKDEFL